MAPSETHHPRTTPVRGAISWRPLCQQLWREYGRRGGKTQNPVRLRALQAKPLFEGPDGVGCFIFQAPRRQGIADSLVFGFWLLDVVD